MKMTSRLLILFCLLLLWFGLVTCQLMFFASAQAQHTLLIVFIISLVVFVCWSSSCGLGYEIVAFTGHSHCGNF